LKKSKRVMLISARAASVIRRALLRCLRFREE
jgi:hypothetical protein